MRATMTRRLSRPGLRLGRLSAPATASLLIIVVVFGLCLLAPVIAPYDPLLQTGENGGPSLAHWFGLDQQTRDIFSRLLYGGRWSLLIGLSSTLIALVLGAILGSIAATAPRPVDEVIMRVLDILMAFPGIALAAVLVTVSAKEIRIPVLIIAIAVVYSPMVARIVRANVLAQYGEDYVAAEKVIGARTFRIIFRHVSVNCAAPILVFCTLLVADAIVFEAGLSFIGAGMPEEQPSWGSVMAGGKNMAQIGAWWGSMFPGLLILLTVLTLNILAEGITDAMANPGLRRSRSKTATVDPAAEVAQAETAADVETGAEPQALTRRLDQLRKVELTRTDRLTYAEGAEPLLEVKNLSIRFPARYGDVAIVDDVDFTLHPGETMGLVGESGCGKSITSLAIMGLLAKSAEVTGEINFNGQDLLRIGSRQRNALRGHDMSMIYQDALSSLNPAMLIKTQLGQLLKRGGTRTAEELMGLVGLDPERTLKSYPHELSGGQRQRVLIAMALTRDPKLVIADEPTTALDVTVQQQVVDLLHELRDQLGFALVFVSHDLALVASLAHRVTVMYAGQVVETGAISDVLTDPRHEYTRGLLGSVLSIEEGSGRLHQIPGTVPSPRDFGTGDRFAARSAHSGASASERPVLVDAAAPGHRYATNRDVSRQTTSGGVR